MIAGTADTEVGRKFFATMAEFTNIGFFSIVALRFVSQKELAFNAIGAALATVAIVAVLDVYVKQMLDLVDFTAVTMLGLSVVMADHGKNPKATAGLAVATGLYGVVQLPWTAYESAVWFPHLISGSSLAFSLCLLLVLSNRSDAHASASVGLYPKVAAAV